MIEPFKLFCTSHKDVAYLDKFEHLTLTGCGNSEFRNNWLTTNSGININDKFKSYADLTAQFWIWQNYIKKNSDKNLWVGISQYRRHWLNSNFDNKKNYNLNDLDSIILKNAKNEWKNYDSILTAPFTFKKNFFESIKTLNLLKRNTTIKEQMINSLGQDFEILYEELLTKLPSTLGKEFNDYIISNNKLSAHGMYIGKPKILNEFMTIAFDWYKKCENITNPKTKKKISDIPRFFQYLNERFSDFWFKKKTNFTTCPIGMYDTQKNKISLIGKIT